MSVVCCQVEICATSLSLIQRIPTDCGASLCVIQKPRELGGPGPLGGGGAVVPKRQTNRQINKQEIILESNILMNLLKTL